MPYRFKRKESLRDGTLRIADAQVRRVSEHLSAPTDRALHVHAARQRLKRLRSLLRLMRPGLPRPLWRHADRLCRDVASAVGPARDATVAAETFDGLAAELLPLEAGALATVRTALSAHRPAAEAEGPWPWPEADRQVAALQTLPALLAQADLPQGWEPLGQGFRRCCRQGRDAMRLAYAHPTDGRFHQWRKRAKDRWHQTLLVRACWRPILGSLTDELKRLGDLLGADHDLAVLRRRLAQLPAADLSPGLQALLLERIAAKQAALRRQARGLGERLYAEKPKRTARRLGAYWKAWRKRRRLPKALGQALDYSI